LAQKTRITPETRESVTLNLLFDPYVFSGDDTFLHVSRIYAKYAKQAGVMNLRLHDLRHRFGYRMAERTPLHRLAQIMGHDSLDTTMLYVKGTQQDLQQAVETIAWE
jgi:integrase/recombinase XerC